MSKLFLFSFICMFLLGGCVSQEMRKSEAYHRITPKEAHRMISELEEYIILDVRTEAEHQKKHIPGAVSIPLGQIKDRAEKELPDKNAMIFVHCLSGGRSTLAAKELFKMGYSNIYDFEKITKWPGETVSN